MIHGIYLLLLVVRKGSGIKFSLYNFNCFILPKYNYNIYKMYSNDRIRVSSKVIKNQFINYFESKGHTHWPGSSVIPNNDPSLLFVNAGMNQFKKVITGQVDRDSKMGKLTRVCNFQRCIRAGGKHNDLDDVGKDSYHHTFFEMLGNWSFGDYLKDDAIDFAWDLLVNIYKLDSNRLYATYFGGDDKNNIPPDNESRDKWLKYLPEHKVIPFGCKDNFWEMSDTGPCGPCTEIHYDHVGNRDASSLVNADSPQVVELWNLVFMEYNRERDGSLHRLPKKCVDTGMGFERLVSVINGCTSNYDTDLFTKIHSEIQNILPDLPGYSGRFGDDDELLIDTSYRVISDHMRCLTVAISDGCDPSNDGRGYVLRRILRRAIIYGKLHFNADKPWLYKLVPIVCETLEISGTKADRVANVIYDEEVLFLSTIDKGVDKFNKLCNANRSSGGGGVAINGGIISGKDAFLLYSSFGFPFDITQIMANERGMVVDRDGFDRALIDHQRASESMNSSGDVVNSFISTISAEVLDKIEQFTGQIYTDDSLKYDWVLDGDSSSFDCRVIAIWDGDSLQSNVDSENPSIYGLILDKTPFYSESGGQVSDIGYFTLNGQRVFNVLKAHKMGSYVIHIGTILNKINIGDIIKSNVLYDLRSLSARNHTATHMLNYVVRRILSDSIDQKGSLVDPEKLRFDYNNSKPLEIDQILSIQNMLNEMIGSNLPVSTYILKLDDAMKIKGLRAVFGESYPQNVRLLGIGLSGTLPPIDELDGTAMSLELCGGTHVNNTSEIQAIYITNEESISKGIRRITCISGSTAIESMERMQGYFNQYKLIVDKFQDISNLDLYDQSIICGMNRDELLRLKGIIEKDRYLPILDRKKLFTDIDNQLKNQWQVIKKYQKHLLAVVKAVTSKELSSFPIQNGFYMIRSDELFGDIKHMMIIGKSYAKNPGVDILLLSRVRDVGSADSFVVISEDKKIGDFIRNEFKNADVIFDHEIKGSATGRIVYR